MRMAKSIVPAMGVVVTVPRERASVVKADFCYMGDI